MMAKNLGRSDRPEKTGGEGQAKRSAKFQAERATQSRETVRNRNPASLASQETRSRHCTDCGRVPGPFSKKINNQQHARCLQGLGGGKPPVRLCRRPQLTLSEVAPFLPLGTMPVSFYTYELCHLQEPLVSRHY